MTLTTNRQTAAAKKNLLLKRRYFSYENNIPTYVRRSVCHRKERDEIWSEKTHWFLLESGAATLWGNIRGKGKKGRKELGINDNRN